MQGDMDIVDPLIAEYLERLAGSPDPVEAEMRRYADERDGFPIVGPVLGPLLSQFALLARARRIFEVGSGFGYSAFWFARALEPGASVTLTDFERENLDRARSWLGKAGLIDRCRFDSKRRFFTGQTMNENVNASFEACSVNPPFNRVGIEQANSRFSSPRAISPRASDGTLPCSAVRCAASSLRWASTRFRILNRMSDRFEIEVARQAGKAAFAAATAAATSSIEAKSTSRAIRPVAGS